MNIRSMKADLILKQVALKDAEKTLQFFTRSKDCSPRLKAEVTGIIRALKLEIQELERAISKIENAKKKK